MAAREAVHRDDVGTFARRDLAAILKAEGLGGGKRGGAVGGERGHPRCDQAADHVVEMAVLADVQGVPVVGAKAEIGRGDVGQDRGERVQVLRDGAFAD